MKNTFATKYDFKNAYTEKRIKDAFLELNLQNEIDSITVKDVCNKVGISRSTFYRHFKDIYEVIESIEFEVTEEVRNMLTPDKNSIQDPDERKVRRSLLRLFHNYRFRKTELLTLLDSGKYPASYKRFRKMVLDMLHSSYGIYDTGANPALFDFYMDYAAGTIVDLVIIWLRNDNMNYDEFLSIYLKIFYTDIDLLKSITSSDL